MRVLVVSEDAKERLRAVSALALRPGTEVVEATSAEELRQRVIREGERFDVFVVDGDLYPRGGFATLYELRARCDLEGIDPSPSIVLTSREADAWLASWAGASVVVRKPVDAFDLARRVAALEGAEVLPYGDAGAAAQQVAAAAVEDPR